MDTPQQVPFQGSAQSVGFRPVTPASSTEAAARNMQGVLDSHERFNAQAAAYDQVVVRNAGKDMAALAEFSGTLSNFLTEQVKKQNERDMEEGLMLAYTDGISETDAMEFDIAEGYLRDQDEKVQRIGDAAQQSGAELLGVKQIRELSGWKKYGYYMGLAQNASNNYPAFIEQALQELDPNASAADKAVALAQARQEFFRQTGLLGMNPALLNKHAFPQMREADSIMLNRWRKQDQERYSEELIGQAEEILGASPTENFGKALDTLVRSGKYNRTTARDTLLKMITNPDDIDAIGSSLSWDGVKTWAEKYPLQWAAARREAIQRESQNYQVDQEERNLEARRLYDQVSELWEQEAPSEAELERTKRFMMDEYGYIDPRLEQWQARSTDQEVARYYDQQFAQMERAGLLTEAIVRSADVPDSVYRKYLPIAQQQDKARTEVPEFKQYSKQLEADIKRITNTEGLQPGPAGMELAIAKANGDFQRYYMAGIQASQNPAEAAQNAYNRVSADLQQGVAGQGAYKFSATDGFTELTKGGFSTGWEQHRAAVNAKLKYGGVASLDKYALIPRSILEDAVQGSNNPNYSIPPIAQYISDLTGGTVSPWAVLDRQARAQGLGGLVPNPRLQSQVQDIRPELARLLTYRPSGRRTTRAYASTGTFNPDRIPAGYGQVVLKAAQTYGIDPAILAGLIETESHWNPRARSSAGAVGIAQIMPGYHPTVDPTNATASIMYAAKYLSELRQQLGSMDEAIYAYNGGPGGIRKSKENREYHPKVMKAAAKYGYNPTGNPWRNPALLNPRLAYITANIGPTSTGEHLDVKQVGGGNFAANALDNYVEVDDRELGRVPLGKVPVTADQANHRRRNSHGIDYGTYSGTRVYLKNGARVVGSVTTEHGDKVTIELPNKQRYTFLHGRSP